MFSLIMPCYNSEDYIRDAVDSVRSQTFQNWELIAVNDGSTDSTLEILEQYASEDPRIRIFSKPNGGYCSAINYGLDRVSGEYFLFMGSDDRLSSELFASIHAAMNQTHWDMVGFRTLRFVDGVTEGVDADTDFDSCVSVDRTTIAQFEVAYPKHARIFFVRDTSKCYRTALLGDLRYFGKYGFDADGIFSMLFSHRAKSFLSVPVDGYYWTLRKDSLSGKPTTAAIDRDRLENWAKFYDRIAQYNPADITATERSYICIFLEIAKGYSTKITCSDKDAWTTISNSSQYVFRLKKKYKIVLSDSAKGKLSCSLFLHVPKLWSFLKTR